MWTPVYQDPDEISYIHAGPTAVNNLGGYFSIKGEADICVKQPPELTEQTHRPASHLQRCKKGALGSETELRAEGWQGTFVV